MLEWGQRLAHGYRVHWSGWSKGEGHRRLDEGGSRTRLMGGHVLRESSGRGLKVRLHPTIGVRHLLDLLVL